MNTPTTEQRVCEKHGAYEATHHWREHWSGCPACVQEERERLELARREAAMQDRRETFLMESGLVGRYLETTFATYAAETPQQRAVLVACRSYAQGFRDGAGTLWLIGPPGTGKTHLGSATVRDVIERHVLRARITTPRRIVRRLRATWRKDAGETESDVIREYLDDALLVLDEVGVSFGSEAELVQLFDVLDARYQRRLPTLLLTNLTPQLLREELGDRLYDRMREGARVLVLDWPSYRGRA